jgi:glucokinase
MEDFIACFDVGGTRIKYGLVSLDGSLLKSGTIPSDAYSGAEVLYNNLVSYIIEFKKEGNMLAIGLGLSGGVDPDKGVVLLPGKFKALEGYPIVPKLRATFGIPVYADNDGRLAVYAEKHFGAAKDVDWAVVLTIGTGIGSGVIIDGKIFHDQNLQFGTQIGHIITDYSSDQTCLTGNKGTGEMLCSATALALQVRNGIQRGLPSILSEQYFENPLSIDFEKVIEACRQGDKFCLAELDVWINRLSIVLINAVHSYGPRKIILSGGATFAADLFLEKLSEIVNRKVFRYPVNDPVEIVISEIQQYAGVLGAAAFIMEKTNIANYDRVD